MKIAIISDIHGNMLALSEVLKDIEKEKCQKIFCLGDLALAGPEPNETVNFVRNQDWTIIQGNTDEMIAEFSQEILDRLTKNAPIMANALAYDVTELSEENLKYLKNLPKNMEIEIENVKILLVHGSPRRNNEDIMPNQPIETIEEMVKDVNADVVFCGHTHIPCGYQTNNKITVVNVGSVGRPFTDNPEPCYAVIEVDKGELNIKHKFVNYDKEKASQILASRPFEGAKKLSEILINPTERHI